MRALSLGSILFLTWVLLSGYFTPLLLGFGVASSLIVVLIAARMDLLDPEGHPISMTPALAVYWLWLAYEIIKSNIDVARRIWSRGPDITPTLLRLRASQTSALGQVIYANSITLTPGTVTIQIDDGELLVHALAEEVGNDLAGGEMDRRVTWLEGRGP